MEHSGTNQSARAKQATLRRAPEQQRKTQAREADSDLAVLPVLGAARAPLGQMDAPAVWRMTHLAGNDALSHLMHRGKDAAEGLRLPDRPPESGRPLETAARSVQETTAAEGLAFLTPLTGGEEGA